MCATFIQDAWTSWLQTLQCLLKTTFVYQTNVRIRENCTWSMLYITSQPRLYPSKELWLVAFWEHQRSVFYVGFYSPWHRINCPLIYWITFVFIFRNKHRNMRSIRLNLTGGDITGNIYFKLTGTDLCYIVWEFICWFKFKASLTRE